MSLVVSAVAACTPVGLHAESTCAALRAGLAHLKELSTYSVDGEQFARTAMIGGRVPTEWLEGAPPEEKWPGHQRFGLPPPPPKASRVEPGVERVLELCRVALDEIVDAARIDWLPRERYGIYLGLGEEEPAALVLDEVRARLGGEPATLVAETSGRAAGLSLLARAAQDLADRRVDTALVGGVDSLIRRPVAERLDEVRRIRCKSAPDGFNPGEAAAFVCLETAASATGRGCEPLAALTTVVVAEEPTAGTDEPNCAVGLSQALRTVREQGRIDSAPLVVCDLNGERSRALEWGLALTRALGDVHGKLVVWHPADCIGDPGAAAAPLDLAWAAVALHRGYAPTSRALVWGASDGGLRGAALLDRLARHGR